MEELLQHIEKLVGLIEDISAVTSSFKKHTIKKKQNLLTEGHICNANYFVASGCLRLFFINDKGIEHTTQFALENWWLADYTSFFSRRPSEFYIQAVENTTVIEVSYTQYQQLPAQFPSLDRYFRLVHQRAHAAAQYRMKVQYDNSREELYRDFASRFPEFVQRIPQYLLASYLGFTPEYLSEIRRKKIS